MQSRQTAVFGGVLFVAWALAIAHAKQQTVVAVVVKNHDDKGPPILDVGGKKVQTVKLDIPKEALQTQAASQKVQFNIAQDTATAPVVEVKPEKVMKFKLIKLTDEDIKREQEEKRQQKLKDDAEAALKKKLYPCEDYYPHICVHYTAKYLPLQPGQRAPQCRDYWTQTNCRETCNLCKIPVGVFLGGQDLDHCVRLAQDQCVHDWVRETCKAKCGGNPWQRVAASNIYVGKKKSIVHTPKEEEKAPQATHSIKLHTEAEKEENAIPKRKTEDDIKPDNVTEDNTSGEDEPDQASGNIDENMEESSSETMEDESQETEDKPVEKVEPVEPVVKKETTAAKSS